MKTIDIANEQNIKPINNLNKYLNPEFVYIPIKNNLCLQVLLNEKIYKGTIIYKDELQCLYSPISGKFKGLVKIGQSDYAVIANDFEELSILNGKARNLLKIKKDDFLKLIQDKNLVEKLNSVTGTLYINCLENEPYFFNSYMLIKDESKVIIEACKDLLKLLNLKKIVLVIKNNYIDFLNNECDIISEFGTISYLNVPNIYPLGYDQLLQNYLIHNNCDKLINISDLMQLIYQIKKNTIRDFQYITIYGNTMNIGYVVKVKKYTYLIDVFKKLDLNFGNVDFILNNSLMGECINPNEIVISDQIKGIIVNKKGQYDELPCNNCGLCFEVCPVKINPLIKSDKCLKCGLCNYICPAKINVVERIQK